MSSPTRSSALNIEKQQHHHTHTHDADSHSRSPRYIKPSPLHVETSLGQELSGSDSDSEEKVSTPTSSEYRGTAQLHESYHTDEDEEDPNPRRKKEKENNASTSATAKESTKDSKESNHNNNNKENSNNNNNNKENGSGQTTSGSSEVMVSNAGQHGEWEFRKITMMGVLLSFVSQLKPGQDLTRVSLPAVLLHPYSILEMIGYRHCRYFNHLLPVQNEPDPLNRMLNVVKWYLVCSQTEYFHKKPYNPIKGEIHRVASATKEWGRTEFLAEQVSHHPPAAAIFISNAQTNIAMNANFTFAVKFAGNNVNIITEASAQINVPKYKEQYLTTKFYPDVIMTNVLWGRRYLFWTGEVTITCPATKWSVTMNFKEKSNENICKGTIQNLDESTPILEFEGKCGREFFIKPYGVKDKSKKKPFINTKDLKHPEAIYSPVSELDPLDSMVIWKECSEFIIQNRMDLADNAKKKVEEAQRTRREQGEEYDTRFFVNSEDGWIPKDMLGKNLDSDSDEEDFDIPKPPLNPQKDSRKPSDPVLSPTTAARSPKPKAKETDTKKLQRLPDTTELYSGWIKVRNSVKVWNHRWCVLKPGKLVLYKDDKNKVKKQKASGVIRLFSTKVKERPTQMEGFSFKIFSTLQYPIYDKYGLRGERSLRSLMTPTTASPTNVVLLVQSEHDRKNWISAIRDQIEYAKTFDSTRVTGEPEEEDQIEDEEENDVDLVEGYSTEIVNIFSQVSRKANRSFEKKANKKITQFKTDAISKVNSLEKKAVAAQTNLEKKNSIALSPIKIVILILISVVFGFYL